jgi:pimeloyl-ACP methyl ester carboxylesterase
MERLRASDGIGIAYKEWDGDPARPPVVLQHGFAASGELNWEGPGSVAALVATGRRVVSVDARGHGESDKPHDPACYGESRMARDLIELFDAKGYDTVDLAGYSMGAIVAILTATMDTRIRRLVVGGIGAGVVELGGVDTRRLNNTDLAAALRVDDPNEIDDDYVRGFRTFSDLLGNDRLALAAQAEAVHKQPIPFDAISAESLVIDGSDDELAERPEVLADALHARLVLIEGDHVAASMSPDLTRALVDFLTHDDT